MTQKKSATTKELSDVITIPHIHFQDWEYSKAHQGKPNMVCSFTEIKAAELTTSGSNYIKWNGCQMSRIYPKGMRIGSSNYDPCPYWTSGCQIVALNYQTKGEPMWMNEGVFQENDRTGYLLKHHHLRSNDTAFDPNKLQVSHVLKIKIIDAFQLPIESTGVVDPYVKVCLWDPKSKYQREKTKVIHGNGFNPVWEEEFKFQFSDPEYTILTLVIHDHDNYAEHTALGYFSLRLKNLRTGYRSAPLKDPHTGAKLHSTLFVYTSIENTG